VKRAGFLVLAALLIAPANISQAAVSAKSVPIKVLPVAPIMISNLTGAVGDQVSALALTPSAIVIAGTVESSSATSAWVTSNLLGGTDGFIAALDATGNHLWDIRLGTAQDDVASALAIDKQGNFWVVGSSQGAVLPQPVASPTPNTAPTINPDGVKVVPVVPPAPGLTRLVLWRVSPGGQLLNTYSYDSVGVIFPQSISITATGVSIAGRLVNSNNLQSFAITFDGTKFSTPSLYSQRVTSVAFNRTFVTPHGTIKSYIAMGAIPGIPSWKSKAAVPVVIQYSKAKTILAANYIHGTVVDMQYQRNLGVVAITNPAGGYGLYVLTPRS